MTCPGDPERAGSGAGGSAEGSPESWGQTSKAAGFWSSFPQTSGFTLVFPLWAPSQLQEVHASVCVCGHVCKPKWVYWHQGGGQLRPFPPHRNELHGSLSDGSGSSRGTWARVGSGAGAGTGARRGHKAKERGW